VTVLAGAHRVEITTFRGEGAYVDGRRPETVTFHRDLEADLARRDFTMNALAWDPIGGAFRDPFGGRADLRGRLVRAVGDAASRFAEDGLRPVRAVRFAAQLGYGLERATARAIRGALPVVARVSVERVADELLKIAVSPHAADGLSLLASTGLLGAVLPELAALPAGGFRHAARVAARVPPDAALRLAAVLHPLGAAHAEAVAVRLRLARRLSDEIRALVDAHGCVRAGAPGLPATAAEVRRWIAAVGRTRLAAVLALARAEAGELPAPRARRRTAALRRLAARAGEAIASGAPLDARDLALDGRAVMAILGSGPGPRVGEALRHLLDRVLDDPALNDRERLADLLRRWEASRL
jgi:tRNA nucleotidyltransferase (CCA-adding enzyme)